MRHFGWFSNTVLTQRNIEKRGLIITSRPQRNLATPPHHLETSPISILPRVQVQKIYAGQRSSRWPLQPPVLFRQLCPIRPFWPVKPAMCWPAPFLCIVIFYSNNYIVQHIITIPILRPSWIPLSVIREMKMTLKHRRAEIVDIKITIIRNKQNQKYPR